MSSFQDYLKVRDPHLFEMAIPKDVAKKPILFDEDDLEFLHQFPSQHWGRALKQRYDMLFGGLKDRFDRRKPDYDRIKERIAQALYSGNHDDLAEISPELAKKATDYSHVQGDAAKSREAAKHLAYFEIEKIVPHVQDDQPQVFKFEGNGGKMEILAKPYLNRLAHKLERTRGEEHVKGSGLEGKKGQYGYDLYDPLAPEIRGSKNKPQPATTRGFKFPDDQSFKDSIGAWMSQNAHGLFGDLPERDEQGNKIVWKVVNNRKDTWTIKNVFDRIFSEINRRLSTAQPGEMQLPDGTPLDPKKIETRSEWLKIVRKMANAELLGMAQRGELKGPPNPLAPEGFPAKIGKRAGQMEALHPDLALPHVEKTITVMQDGRPVQQKVLVPYLKPSTYLRELGSEDGDEGIDPSLLRGHDKNYVFVSDQAYTKKKGYLATAAFHPNQNTAGREHLDPTDPEFEGTLKSLQSEMGETFLDAKNLPSKNPANSDQGQFFFDIIKGIWNCINSACGGMTTHEVEIMKSQVPDIHNLIMARMVMDLRDPRLSTPKGRRQFAKDVASSWAQQDLGQGGGTRRLRRLTQSARHRSLQATGGEADGMSLSDAIEAEISSSGARDAGDDTTLAKGQRPIATGAGQFNYNLDNFRDLVRQTSQDAEIADRDRDKARAAAQQGINAGVISMIENGLQDSSSVMLKVRSLLKQMYATLGYKPDAAEAKANDKMSEMLEGHRSSKDLIQRFQNDPQVKAFLQGDFSAAGDDSQRNEADRENLERFRATLSQVGEKIREKPTQDLLRNFVRTQFGDAPIIRQELDRAIAGATGQASPAPAQAPQDAKAIANQLIRDERWVDLAMNDFFRRNAPDSHLKAVVGKLAARRAAPQAGDDPNKIRTAEILLTNILRSRGAK